MAKYKTGLTEREKLFVYHYVKEPNQTKAIFAAGYHPKNENSAHVYGNRLLRKAIVASAVAIEREKIAQRNDQSLDRWLREVLSCAFLDPRELYDEKGNLKPMSEWPNHVAAAVSEIESFEEYEGRGKERELTGHNRRVKFWNKLEALKLAGQVLGYIKDKATPAVPAVQVNVGILLNKLPLDTRRQLLEALRQTNEEPKRIELEKPNG